MNGNNQNNRTLGALLWVVCGAASGLIIALIVVILVILVTGTGYAAKRDSGTDMEFWAGRESVSPGECEGLYWRVQSNDTVSVYLDNEGVPESGDKQICPEETTTYELRVEGVNGKFTQKVTVNVEGEKLAKSDGPEADEAIPSEEGAEADVEAGDQDVSISFVADPDSIVKGECAMLVWEVTTPAGEHPVMLDGQEVAKSGEKGVCPQSTTSYKLIVGMQAGPKHASVTVDVTGGDQETEQPPAAQPPAAQPPAAQPPAAQPPAPKPCAKPVIASFSANPSTITAGDSSTLSWGTVMNATSAVIDHGIGGVATPGSKVVSPATTTTYTLTATGCGGTAKAQTTVTVNAAPPVQIIPPAILPVLPPAIVGDFHIFSADLAVTDIFPESLPLGNVKFRLTNNGPDTLANAELQQSCKIVVHGYTDGYINNGFLDYTFFITLKPGETADIGTGQTIDTSKYWYDLTCSITSKFDDPNTANNSYHETIPTI